MFKSSVDHNLKLKFLVFSSHFWLAQFSERKEKNVYVSESISHLLTVLLFDLVLISATSRNRVGEGNVIKMLIYSCLILFLALLVTIFHTFTF